jgi:hypothetical protein
MCGEVISDKNLMQVGAGDIVHLNILADVVAEIAKLLVVVQNGVYTSNLTSRALTTPSNMWSQACIPRLDCKYDGNLCTMVVVPIFLDTQYLHSPPPLAGLHFSIATPNLSNLISFHQGTWNTPRGGGQLQKIQTRN